MDTKEKLMALWAEASKITPKMFSEGGTLILPDYVCDKMRELQQAMPEGDVKNLADEILRTGRGEFNDWFKNHFEHEISLKSNCHEVLCAYLKRWWCGQTLFHEYTSPLEAKKSIFEEDSTWDIVFKRLEHALKQAGVKGGKQ